MFTAPVAALVMGRFGRRPGFLIGTLAGALGGGLSAQALFEGSFGLLLLGSVCTGVFQAFQAFVRFAAADAVPGALKPRAISWVLAAGLINALVGPEVVRWLGDAMAPTPFAGAYLAIVAINVAGAAVLVFLQIPRPMRRAEGQPARRSLRTLLGQPQLIAAMACGMVSYAVMSLIMTPTSLAMTGHGFETGQAADVVRWHVFAMYAPSFFTGHLVGRFGHARVIGTGLLLLVGCAAIALSGVEIHHFYLALMALGVGWNFGFIGSTSLLATTHTPEEQSVIQGLNDFMVFGLVATASFSSGALLSTKGWSAVQFAAIPMVAVALGVLVWSARRGEGEGSEPFLKKGL